MSPREFERRRARIESAPKRGSSWRKRALQKIVRESGAEVVIAARKVIAYKMASGEFVCKKQRFKTEPDAIAVLGMIANEHQPRLNQPIRAYPCYCCKGWHLTSERSRYA